MLISNEHASMLKEKVQRAPTHGAINTVANIEYQSRMATLRTMILLFHFIRLIIQ